MAELTSPTEGVYERRIEYARPSLWLPFYGVGMVARIEGDVSPELLQGVLRKLQVLHPPLASRVRLDPEGNAWLTTDGVGEYSLDVRRRTSGDQWMEILLEQDRIPFAFDRGPLARFFLLRGDGLAEVGLVAPHVVCDGYSTAHVMFDVVRLLNDPGRAVAAPPSPPAVTWRTMPHAVGDGLLLRGFVAGANRILRGSRRALDYDGYLAMHRRYWARRHVGVLAFGLSGDDTERLVARCRQQGVSVTAALVAAFLLAERDVRSPRCILRQLSMAVNIRNRLTDPPGTAVSVCASTVDLALRVGPGREFWELARQGHTRIQRGVNDRHQVLRPLVMEGLDPRIADRLVADIGNGTRKGVPGIFLSFLRAIAYARSLDVSNIGRVELPDLGLPYRLETLLPWPPLVPGGIALNTITVRGRLAGTLKFRQEALDGATAARIRDGALRYLEA